MKVYGLIGINLDHSFSPVYFENKFIKEKITNASYKLFPIHDIRDFKSLIQENQDLSGLNVTIPYKQQIIPYLDELDFHAKNIGAVNTIKFIKQNNSLKLKGFNTDYLGFIDSLLPILPRKRMNALILGTGGASRAVTYALKILDIGYKSVSRNPAGKNELSYNQLDKNVIENHQFIINTTPLGMHPGIEEYPLISYQYLTKNHLVYDLIYNPIETTFLRLAKEKGATIKNGIQMLEIQADYSWKIWNDL
ncbi:MAG: shikimate dehydrogenase [Bacteroidetes bacterium GWC2_33_15]|nr:MAG: shikimate dehydrogenase [Bacteroidetes bacterium GWA2_33_15]OFX50589.1 MAG: shikimate dehydrogenase [Bacteroidetes bacterium GWC2_33_15]OFX64126.1 MAG: shikimate dehydrogenase [Bacteroidetes bacterium GWB2_32_14]OFX69738.1 MAG: shikimate dehydrogenase [Bacteroidetes bacterium GWD2_33_33]HAN19774.1 shikimate dehydrogenase [Bacteroidales bacterium]